MADVNAIREDAIEAGVEEYYLNEDNDKAFRWKVPPEYNSGDDTATEQEKEGR